MSFAAFPCPQPDGYHSYLIRLWQTGPDGPWRASLQCVQTNQKLYFVTLDSLFIFLQTQTAPFAGELHKSESAP